MMTTTAGPPETEPDLEALARCLEAFVAEIHGAIYGFCYHHCPTPQDAEDATQETFLRLTRAVLWPTTPAQGEVRQAILAGPQHWSYVRAYTYVIARNVINEHWRHQPPPSQSLSTVRRGGDEDGAAAFDIPDPGPTTEEEALEPLAHPAERVLFDFVSLNLERGEALSPKQGECVRLSVLHGLARDDIAGLLKIAVDRVKEHRAEGVRRLQGEVFQALLEQARQHAGCCVDIAFSAEEEQLVERRYVRGRQLEHLARERVGQALDTAGAGCLDLRRFSAPLLVDARQAIEAEFEGIRRKLYRVLLEGALVGGAR